MFIIVILLTGTRDDRVKFEVTCVFVVNIVSGSKTAGWSGVVEDFYRKSRRPCVIDARIKIFRHPLDFTLAIGLLVIALGWSPWLNDPFTPAKWAVFFCFCALALTFAKFSEQLKINLLALTYVAVCCSVFLVNVWFFNSHQITDTLICPLSVIALSCAFWVAMNSERDFISVFRDVATFTLLAVSAVGVLQIKGFNIMSGLRAATFGNENMTAEFLLFCVALAVSSHDKTWIWRLVPVGLANYYIILLTSRSALIAVLWIYCFLFFMQRALRKKVFIGFLVTAAIYLLVAHLPNFTTGESSNPPAGPIEIMQSANKSYSANQRLLMWELTLKMIRDHPYGVGTNQFEFAYIPYQMQSKHRETLPVESEMWKSPHNEFLRFAVEEGLLLTFLLLAGWAYLVINAAKIFLRKDVAQSAANDEKAFLFLTMSGVLMVQSLFQFPFQNGGSCYFVSFILGLGTHLLSANRSLQRRAIVIGNALLMAAAIFIVWKGAGITYSNYLYATQRHLRDQTRFACELSPSNWRACIVAAVQDIDEGESARGLQQLESILSHQKHNYPALRELAKAHLKLGYVTKGCAELGAYDYVFGGLSSVRELRENLCGQRIDFSNIP